MTLLYITPSFSTSTVQYYMQMPITTFGAYRVCRSIDIYCTVRYRHTYSRVQTYIQYGTDIWHRHKVCTDKRCIHMCADYRTDIPYWNMIHICMYSTLYIWCRQTDQPFSTDIPYTVHTYVLNQKKKWKGSRGHMTHMAWLTFSLGQKGHNR